jgi:hypothetical protein
MHIWNFKSKQKEKEMGQTFGKRIWKREVGRVCNWRKKHVSVIKIQQREFEKPRTKSSAEPFRQIFEGRAKWLC